MNKEQEKLVDIAFKEWDSFPAELKAYATYERSGDVIDLLDYISEPYHIPFFYKRDVLEVIHLIAIGSYEIAINKLKRIKQFWKDSGYNKKLGAFTAEIKAIKKFIKQSWNFF